LAAKTLLQDQLAHPRVISLSNSRVMRQVINAVVQAGTLRVIPAYIAEVRNGVAEGRLVTDNLLPFTVILTPIYTAHELSPDDVDVILDYYGMRDRLVDGWTDLWRPMWFVGRYGGVAQVRRLREIILWHRESAKHPADLHPELQRCAISHFENDASISRCLRQLISDILRHAASGVYLDLARELIRGMEPKPLSQRKDWHQLCNTRELEQTSEMSQRITQYLAL